MQAYPPSHLQRLTTDNQTLLVAYYLVKIALAIPLLAIYAIKSASQCLALALHNKFTGKPFEA